MNTHTGVDTRVLWLEGHALPAPRATGAGRWAADSGAPAVGAVGGKTKNGRGETSAGWGIRAVGAGRNTPRGVWVCGWV